MGITRYAKKGTKQVIKWKLKLPSGAHFILFCCRYEYIATADRVYFALERFLVKNNKCVFAYAIYRVHNNRRRRKQSETIKKQKKTVLSYQKFYVCILNCYDFVWVIAYGKIVSTHIFFLHRLLSTNKWRCDSCLDISFWYELWKETKEK